ncbi:TRAP transporter substrate-binding protein [Roseovarius sp.]|uniref:TRAP transporter substrate-binding protein n=1 Tax=Roseovarius sp. TaxID=1486281 RepID=UPI003B5AA514
MTTSWPKGFPGLGTASDDFADLLSAATGGRLTVTVHGAGEIAPGLKAMDAVADGTADLYHSADYYYLGKSKALAFFATVPFGMTPEEYATWIRNDGGQQLWDEISAEFGIKPFSCGNTGGQSGGWFNKEINSLDDLKGLNIRMPGLGGDVMRRLGANAVTLAGGEIAPALQAGTIDATEWVGPWNDYAFGLHKLATYYYLAGFHEPALSLSLGVNKRLYDDMSPADQALIATCAAAADARSYTDYLANNGAFLDRIVSEGVEIRSFPEDVWEGLGRASREIFEENAASDETFAKTYSSYRESMAKTASWLEQSDRVFLEQRNRLFDI